MKSQTRHETFGRIPQSIFAAGRNGCRIPEIEGWNPEALISA
jgi:hypothetical protein